MRLPWILKEILPFCFSKNYLQLKRLLTNTEGVSMYLSTSLLLSSNIWINIYQMAVIYWQQVALYRSLLQSTWSTYNSPDITHTFSSCDHLLIISSTRMISHSSILSKHYLSWKNHLNVLIHNAFAFYQIDFISFPLWNPWTIFCPCYSFLYTPSLKILNRTHVMEVSPSTQK